MREHKEKINRIVFITTLQGEEFLFSHHLIDWYELLLILRYHWVTHVKAQYQVLLYHFINREYHKSEIENTE